MRTLELMGQVDEENHLQVELPADTPVGAVHVIVLIPEGVEAEQEILADWLAVSSSSLREVWDNEQDADYDAV
jgi:hypothetical protein